MVASMPARRCPYTPGTFRAVQWADGPIYVRCDACRRYVQLAMTADLAERQIARTTFSCCECGAAGHLTGDDPARRGYRLDPRDHPRRHPLAVARLTGRLGGSSYGRPVF
jgi:hypothetical protein